MRPGLQLINAIPIDNNYTLLYTVTTVISSNNGRVYIEAWSHIYKPGSLRNKSPLIVTRGCGVDVGEGCNPPFPHVRMYLNYNSL